MRFGLVMYYIYVGMVLASPSQVYWRVFLFLILAMVSEFAAFLQANVSQHLIHPKPSIINPLGHCCCFHSWVVSCSFLDLRSLFVWMMSELD